MKDKFSHSNFAPDGSKQPDSGKGMDIKMKKIKNFFSRGVLFTDDLGEYNIYSNGNNRSFARK